MLPEENEIDEEIITAPTLTVKVIKKILLQEYNDFKSHLYSISEFHIKQDYWGDAIDSIADEINECMTYNDLDKFVGNHYRMSLYDWVGSL